MAIRRLSDLEDHLDSNFSWRRTELQVFVAEVESLPRLGPQLPKARAMLRSAVLLSYAHWEGFSKDAFQGYIDFLANQKLKHQELCDDLLLTSVETIARRLSSGDPAARDDLLKVLRSEDLRAQMPRRWLVDTENNLRWKVLDKITLRLGLRIEDLALRQKFIDSVLCDNRNEIAHGRDSFLDKEACLEVVRGVLEMMEAVKEEVTLSAEEAKYRRR